MQLCSDSLKAVRCVGSNQQWCVSLPACYPKIIPYVPTNIECNCQEASNLTAFDSGFNNYNTADIIDSSLCVNSQLIQRIRHKVNIYQTPSSKDARQILQRLTNIVKQHVPEFVFKEVNDGDARERTNQSNQNIRQDVSPTFSSAALQSESPSFVQQVIDTKNKDDHVLSKDSSHQSHLFNGSLLSTNLSTLSPRTNGSSRQFSPTQSLQSLSTINGNNFEKKDSKSSNVASPTLSDHTDRESIVMSIPVPSMSSTPYSSDQQLMSSELRQAVHNMMTPNSRHDNSSTSVSTPNVNDRHLDSSHIISAIDLKSSTLLSPFDNQQQVDRILSKQSISTIRSPTVSTNDLGKQELLTQSSTSTYLHRSPSLKSQYSNQLQQRLIKSDENKYVNERKNDYQHRIPEEIRDDEAEKRNNWFKKLMKKMSSKHFSTTSFQNISQENTPHMNISDPNKFYPVQLHMREAMAALELDLTKEAFQALMNKKNDYKQNTLMHILTVPSRCCRSCRTQRRLASVAQRSINIAIKNLQISPGNSKV